jgi:flagellar motor component MotA
MILPAILIIIGAICLIAAIICAIIDYEKQIAYFFAFLSIILPASAIAIIYDGKFSLEKLQKDLKDCQTELEKANEQLNSDYTARVEYVNMLKDSV